jgi:hypothetical protein
MVFGRLRIEVGGKAKGDGRGKRDGKKLKRTEAEKVRRKEGRDQRSGSKDKGQR